MYHVEERSEGLPLQTQNIYFTSYINVNVKWAVLSARRGRTKQVSFAGGPSAKLYWNIKFNVLLRAHDSHEKLQAERKLLFFTSETGRQGPGFPCFSITA